MSSIVWNAARTMGVESIDHQHGMLLDALNELRFAVQHGPDEEEVRLQLNRFARLITLHMEGEDRLLEQQAWPGLESYRAEHRHFRKELDRRSATLLSTAHQKQARAVGELAEFLREWFANHMDGIHRFGPWLQQRGVH